MRIVERLPFLGLALAGGLALAAACTPTDITGPPEQACQQYAYAYCEQLQACSTTFIAQAYGNAATCEALNRATCFNVLTAPSTGDSVSQRQACTQAVSQGAWACTDILANQTPPTPCQRVPGPLDNGQACALYEQCHSTYCAYTARQNCGTCADPPAAGDPCPSGQCASGDVCVPSTQQCAAHATAGSPCFAGLPCEAGLSCVVPAGTLMGTCEVAVTVPNAACVFSGAGCSFNAGLACNAATKTCQAERLGSPGEACGDVGDQVATCMLGTCSRGTCLARPALGASCEVGGTLCATPANCISADGGTTGTCQLRGADSCP